MNKVSELAIIGIVAVAKLVITGACLAIGFRIGGIITARVEKRVAEKSAKSANVEQAVA